MVKRSLAVETMRTNCVATVKERIIGKGGFSVLLDLTREYLMKASCQQERLIYEYIQYFLSQKTPPNAVKQAMKLRLFLFRHSLQRQARIRFMVFVARERRLRMKCLSNKKGSTFL